MNILKQCENNVGKAVTEMVANLSPFDVTDEDVTDLEDRLERLDTVATSLKNKVYKLREDVKAKKFRRKPELLEEDMISCSQYSVLQLEDSEELSETFSQ